MAYAGLFWGLSVYDMLGDIYGARVGALAALVPAVGVPIIYGAMVGCRRLESQAEKIEMVHSGNEDNPLHRPIPQRLPSVLELPSRTMSL